MAQPDAYDQRPASPILCDASEWSEEFFSTRLRALKAEGRYRVFAELERGVREFSRALEHRLGHDVTVWCSNDYLGMGQHPAVLSGQQSSWLLILANSTGSLLRALVFSFVRSVQKSCTCGAFAPVHCCA
jgi:hypothetical protein